jgi:hypothetical protein
MATNNEQKGAMEAEKGTVGGGCRASRSAHARCAATDVFSNRHGTNWLGAGISSLAGSRVGVLFPHVARVLAANDVHARGVQLSPARCIPPQRGTVKRAGKSWCISIGGGALCHLDAITRSIVKRK